MIQKILVASIALSSIIATQSAFSSTTGVQACINAGFSKKVCARDQFLDVVDKKTAAENAAYVMQKTDDQLVGHYKNETLMSILHDELKNPERAEKIRTILLTMFSRSCDEPESKSCKQFSKALKRAGIRAADLGGTGQKVDVPDTNVDAVIFYQGAAGKLSQLDQSQCPGVNYKRFSDWKYNGPPACVSNYFRDAGEPALRRGADLVKHLISFDDPCITIINEVLANCPGVFDAR